MEFGREDTLVVTARGPNAPGVTAAFMAAAERAGSGTRVLDLAQYVVEESLVLSLQLQFGERSSIRIMKDLLATAQGLRMHVNFHFPTQGSGPSVDDVTSRALSISVVVPGMLPPGLLQ